jgi:glycosyltransferase involved in cell wall biosynthesis
LIGVTSEFNSGNTSRRLDINMRTSHNGRVYVDATAFQSGGGVYLNELLPRLIRATPDLEWIVMGEALAGGITQSDGRVQFRRVWYPNATKFPLAAGIVKLLWRMAVLPFIVGRRKRAVLFTVANFASPLFRLINVPYVLAVHNLTPFHHPLWYTERNLARRARQHMLRYLTLASAKSATAVIAFSGYAKSIFGEAGVAPEKVALIYHGVMPQAASWTGQDSDTVLVVSHYYRYKKLEIAIRAFAEFRRSASRSFRLEIQGIPFDYGYYEELIKLVQDLGEGDSITLGTGLPANQLIGAYRRSRCLLFPAIGENCPITILEALAIGVPIVASTAAPLPELCAESAEYYGVFSVKECASAIQRVTQDLALSNALSNRGVARAAYFNWDKSAQATLDVIRTVIRNEPAGNQRTHQGPARADLGPAV